MSVKFFDHEVDGDIHRVVAVDHCADGTEVSFLSCRSNSLDMIWESLMSGDEKYCTGRLPRAVAATSSPLSFFLKTIDGLLSEKGRLFFRPTDNRRLSVYVRFLEKRGYSYRFCPQENKVEFFRDRLRQ